MAIKESDLYQPVKRFLEDAGYEVYAEVEPKLSGNWNARADVIGYNKPAVCIVEMKTSLSVELIEQAYKWLPHAHYIYVAVPWRKKKVPTFILKLLNNFGIGVLEVNSYGRAVTTQRAKFNRPRHKHDWSRILLPQHQTWVEGGNAGGGYVTPYKLTIERVKQYLSRNPHRWFSMQEILDHCETHYSNPKNSLSKALREFEHAWCETRIEKRKLQYRIKGRSF
jgi:hypothetical protein